MAAGTTYNLTDAYQPREFYRVETGVRKSGPWKLDTANLVDGSFLPPFTPVNADLNSRVVTVVRNVKVAEAYTSGTSLKIAKNSLAYAGMSIGNGSETQVVSAIDTSNANYDTLTLAAGFSSAIAAGSVLYEAVALVTGKTKAGTKDATSLDIAKGSGVQAGMKIVIGETTYTVTAVDTSNDAKDVLTLSEGLAANVSNNTNFTEAQKSIPSKTANFVTYDRKKVEVGKIVNVTLLMQAYEVKEAKLPLPISEADKVSLTSRFQFE